MVDLPVEVVTDILSRLSAKQLICFRCVSKPWRSLIDSMDFIHLHLQNSLESKSHFGLILRKDFQLYRVDFDSLEDIAELTHPLMCYNNRIRILGTSNGLLCICNVAGDVALWNPSTKKHRVLPFLPTGSNREPNRYFCGARVYGFGYESVLDDYKLVSISQFIGLDYQSYESEVKVYSLRRNAWKEIESMPYVLCYTGKMGILVNSYLHWVVTRKLEPEETELIVGFDIATERFQEVPIPDSVNHHFEMEVGVIENNLCIVANYQEEGDFEAWVMKEYGVKESWTRLFKIAHTRGTIKNVMPLAYSKTGREVLFEQDHEKLVWYDLKSQRVKVVRLRGMPRPFEAVVFIGSLAPLTVGNRGKNWKNRESRDKNKKRDDFLSEGFKLVL